MAHTLHVPPSQRPTGPSDVSHGTLLLGTQLLAPVSVRRQQGAGQVCRGERRGGLCAGLRAAVQLGSTGKGLFDSPKVVLRPYILDSQGPMDGTNMQICCYALTSWRRRLSPVLVPGPVAAGA